MAILTDSEQFTLDVLNNINAYMKEISEETDRFSDPKVRDKFNNAVILIRACIEEIDPEPFDFKTATHVSYSLGFIDATGDTGDTV